MIPYGKQSIDEDDIEGVIRTLKSSYLTQGPKVSEFENAVCRYVGARYGIAVNSGTSALHIACLALGLGSGDYLWTSPNTFVASANCGLYCGAKVDFVDINPSDGNICVQALGEKLEQGKLSGTLPKVLVVVHFAGQCCDMRSIHALANKYGIAVIEDASHAIGGSRDGDRVGSGEYSHVTTFSFHPVKGMTTAEGGMAVTNDQSLAQQMRQLATHGISKSLPFSIKELEEPWGYEQTDLGMNYRLSDVHAALGLSQLQKLTDFVEQRNALAKRYDDAFKNASSKPLVQHDSVINAYHLYIVLLDEKDDRKQIFIKMREAGIGVHVHYIPVYKQSYYQSLGFAHDYCHGAEQYYRKALTLPLFPGLSAKDQQHVIDTLLRVIEN